MPYYIYLLHFDRPLGRSRHYIGYTRRDLLKKRLKTHANRSGSRLVAAVIRNGIDVYLARLWPTPDPSLERRLKAGHRAGRLCPLCALGLTPRANARINPTLAIMRGETQWVGLSFSAPRKAPNP
jgi:hypothetical protein